jgi:hypothetical protein
MATPKISWFTLVPSLDIDGENLTDLIPVLQSHLTEFQAQGYDNIHTFIEDRSGELLSSIVEIRGERMETPEEAEVREVSPEWIATERFEARMREIQLRNN